MAPGRDHFVVLGGGPAGNEAALTLGRQAPGARVTLIAGEREGPCKPHLLPAYISGRLGEAPLDDRLLGSLRELGIRYRRGQRVAALDLAGRRLIMEHREVVPFTGLIIATGGKARIPEPLLAFREYLHTLKTLEDAHRWMGALAGAETILMIGGDLTSLAMTRALLEMQKRVIFVLNHDAFWPLACDEALFESVGRTLASRGVEVLRSRRLRGVARLPDGLFRVFLGEEVVEVPLIGAFFGLVPEVAFLAGSGLMLDRGVLVDDCLWTGHERVYAAGDCAQVYHPEIKDYWVSIGYENARALGRAAALNLLGEHLSIQPAGQSIIDMEGVKVNTSWWMDF